jgi:hypothetical protein
MTQTAEFGREGPEGDLAPAMPQLPQHCLRPAFDARDDAAGLAHHDLSGREVPWLQIAFPAAVEPAGGDEGQVKRGQVKRGQVKRG